MGEWISVKDRLPDKEARYLVCTTGFLANIEPYIKLASFTTNLNSLQDFKWQQNESYNRPGWYNYDGEGEWEERTVTHWMPLPEPPKESDACV